MEHLGRDTAHHALRIRWRRVQASTTLLPAGSEVGYTP
jgi:hypothetical protein